MEKPLEMYVIPDKHYLKASEVASLFGVDHSTVFHWVKTGKLRPRRTPGRNFRFAREEVERLYNADDKKTPVDHRREPRFGFVCRIRVRIAAEQGFRSYNARISNISNRGMAVVVYNSDDLGMVLDSHAVQDLEILNQQSVALKDTVKAVVCHHRTVGEGRLKLGLKLVG